MSQSIALPDDLYRALAVYAAGQHQTPEEALAALVRSLQLSADDASGTPSSQTSPGNAPDTFADPWQGFYDAFESEYPDLVERHDYYLGQEALDQHEDEGDADRDAPQP